jgi:hypothetical protein
MELKKMNEVDNMLGEQQDWKEFEKCLIPIMEHCELCKEFAICGFHEKWYSQVKVKFIKFRRRYNARTKK